jgi:hypothetical protein
MAELYVHHVRSIEDETDILKKILNLETEIRAKRENERVRDNAQSHALSRIFDPVTAEMRSIKNALNIDDNDSTKSSQRQQKKNLQHQKKIAKLQANIYQHKTDDEDDDDGADTDDDNNENSTDGNGSGDETGPSNLPSIEQPKPLEMVSEYGRNSLGRLNNANVGDSLYQKTLKSIPAYTRGDDRFGVDVNKKTISGHTYTLDGNRLIVDPGVGKRKIFFDIEDPDVWKWLIVRNPKLKTYKADGEPTSAFGKYVHIAQTLKFVERAQRAALAKNGKNLPRRILKYKLLIENKHRHEGSGFLFTARPPSHVRKKTLLSGGKRKKSISNVGGQGLEDVMAKHRCNPNIVVMPTDNRTLLEKLTRCLGEIDAGNQTLVNIATPLKEEAVRRGLISANNPVFKNLNWVLA